MKKFLALCLVLVFCMTFFSACGSKEEDDNVLVMATNASFPPYEYYEGEEIVGIDAEIVAEVASRLGMEFRIEDMEFDSIITAVTTGKADVGLAGMTVTEERKKSVNFSDSYATSCQVVIVMPDSEITTVDDLFAEGAMHTIGVQNATTGDLYTTWDLEDEGLATIERFSKAPDAVLALTSGKVDCVVIDEQTALFLVEENADAGLVILDTEYTTEEYAACFAQENTELLEQFNSALADMKADGTLQAIIDKYISAE